MLGLVISLVWVVILVPVVWLSEGFVTVNTLEKRRSKLEKKTKETLGFRREVANYVVVSYHLRGIKSVEAWFSKTNGELTHYTLDGALERLNDKHPEAKAFVTFLLQHMKEVYVDPCAGAEEEEEQRRKKEMEQNKAIVNRKKIVK